MSLKIKNYKKLEGWSHFGKEFMIGEVIETPVLYSFRVGYNGVPYTIKIFRNAIDTEYEIVLKDGVDMSQYGRTYISKLNMRNVDEITEAFEYIIIRFKQNHPF